jgi:peptide/nickel transport system permease protein
MTSYILRRLLLLFPTLIGMTIVIFAVMAWSPGGIGASLISREGNMRPQERKAMEDYLNKRYGLKDPLPRQYLRWLNKVSPVGAKEVGTGFPASLSFGLKAPDLGESFIRRRPVADLIAEALPITLLLNLISFPIAYVTSIVIGIRAASKRGQAFDVVTGTTFLALWSFPVILAGVLSIGFLANEQYVRWFPTNGLHDILAGDMRYLPSFGADGFQRGYLLDMAWHLVLPIICLSYGDFAVLSKYARGSVLENIAADYARTARSKGVSAKNVLYQHVFRNSLLPLITIAAGILPGMIGGSVIVESVFGINGMGKLSVEAVQMKDPELVLSTAMIAGFLGLLSYLLSDICYAIADPRVSYE